MLQLPSMLANKRWNKDLLQLIEASSVVFFFPPWISSLELKLVVVVARRAAGHHRCTLPSFLCWSREPPGRARTHAHTHRQTGKEKGDWDWTTRQLSAGCVSFRKDHEALFSFLTKTMKLLPPASSSEEVTRPSSARHSSETSRPSGLKLGIVRLGRAGGKVRLFNRHLDLYYIDLELTKFERSEKRSGERNSWHS